MPEVKPDSRPILHPVDPPLLKMNRLPSEFFHTGLFGAAEALSLERTYNPPSDFEVEVSPVTSIAPQGSECVKKCICIIWQYGLWSFQTGGTKLERCLPKNQHTQKKLLNFENWVNGEVSKIGHHFSK